MNRPERSVFYKTVSAIFWMIIIVFTTVAVYEIGGSTTLSRVEQQRNTTRYAAEAEKEIKERCIRGITPDMQAACIQEIIESTNEHKRDESDLVAQTDMALWAFLVAVISAISSVATIFAAYFVYTTYIETRTTGRAQTRAYLTVNGSSFKTYSYETEILFDVKNTGQTPAINVGIDLDLSSQWGLNLEFVRFLVQPRRMFGNISAATEMPLEISITQDDIKTDEARRLFDKIFDGHWFVADLHVTWDDVFGENHTENFRLKSDYPIKQFRGEGPPHDYGTMSISKAAT